VIAVSHVGGLHLRGHVPDGVQGELGRERIGDVCYSKWQGHKPVTKLQTTKAYVLSLCRVRSLWHESQTRTSCVMAKWGSGRDFEEHFWSNTRPQLRQWCLRLVNENGSRQRRQTSESIHSGAVCVSIRAEPAMARSSGGKLNPRNIVAKNVWP